MAKSEASLISRVICVPAKHAEFSAGYLKLGDGKSTCLFFQATPWHFSFGASLLVYLGVGLQSTAGLGTSSCSTLAYVLLLTTLICWGTSGLRFFDRFRFPVVVPLLAIPILNCFSLSPTTIFGCSHTRRLYHRQRCCDRELAHPPLSWPRTVGVFSRQHGLRVLTGLSNDLARSLGLNIANSAARSV
jgi:hypothetical protein